MLNQFTSDIQPTTGYFGPQISMVTLSQPCQCHGIYGCPQTQQSQTSISSFMNVVMEVDKTWRKKDMAEYAKL